MQNKLFHTEESFLPFLFYEEKNPMSIIEGVCVSFLES